MSNYVCHICGKETMELYGLTINLLDTPYDSTYLKNDDFHCGLCGECADIMKKEIELLKVTRTTKPAGYAKISYMEYQASHGKDI